ncbi:MAG: PIG-L family deacetylase [Bryobacteraceae bacterium]|nr:PIG-L family deacetylase [Bryobacteraceae bacterium]
MLAGGTLALLAQRGHSITIVTMTPGDCGSTELAPEEIAGVRRGEARAAAKEIGADYLCAEFRDLAVFNDDPSRRRVTALLRRLRPDLVLTASPVDYMCDHEATSALVRDACFGAPAPNYSTGDNESGPPLREIPHLYFMDAVGGMDRDARPIAADFYVNIGSTFTTKWTMFGRHESQRAWLRKHHGMDNYLETMEEWTRECGRRAGVEFAEGFRLYKGHPYPQTPLVEELLGPEVVVRPR